MSKKIELEVKPLVSKEEFKAAAEEVMETHKGTLEKLAKHDTNNFTASALGLTKNKKTGLWDVIEFKYDPDTLTADNSNVKVIPSNDSHRDVGYERFKITVSQLIFGK